MIFRKIIILLGIAIIGCNNAPVELMQNNNFKMEVLSSKKTGITFENKLTDSS